MVVVARVWLEQRQTVKTMQEEQIHLSSPALEREVARYLATGESDPLGSVFRGAHALERIIGYERYRAGC